MCLKKGVQCITFLQSLMHQVDNMFQVQNMVDETSEERRKQHTKYNMFHNIAN